MRLILRNIWLNVFAIFKKPKAGIHIINSHYVTPDILSQKKDFNNFENYLKYLNKFGDFINVDEATSRILNKDITRDKTLISFTFDDGYEECYTIIAPLLEKYNCRGAFFINANYIESDRDYQSQFNCRTLRFTKRPMNWKQIKDLHKRGHLIGSHGLDHFDFGKLTAKEIEYQIKQNKKILENKLNYNCDYFAWTYGNFKNFLEHAFNFVKKHHKYIFSGTNYKNYFSYHGEVINRRHIELIKESYQIFSII